jgi:hypothetical protein
MSEEDVKKKEVEDGKKGDDTPIYTEVESLAMQIGWNPNHEGERDFVSAKDFIVRSKEIQDTMSTQLKNQDTKLSNLENSLNEVKQHHSRVYKAEVAKLKLEVSRLKTEKNKAISDGDHAKVEEIDGRIKEIEKIPEEVPATSAKKPNPEYEAWLEKNPWYESDSELKQYAITQGNSSEFEGLPYTTMLNKVTERVKAMFPEKFKTADKQKPVQTVETPQAKKKTEDKSKSKYKFSDLTEAQKKQCRDFVRLGVMKEEEYIEDLAKLGAIGEEY